MTAFIAKEAFLGHDENGVDILIPAGSRVEEGDFYHSQNPDYFVPEVEKASFFGRQYQGLTVVQPGPGQTPVTIELSTGEVVRSYTEEEWESWLEAEAAYKLAAATPVVAEVDPNIVPEKPAGRSSIGRRLPPKK